MKIYTSYFANLKALAKAGILPISIARYSPKWFDGLQFKLVAPTSYMLSESCTHEEYLQKYDAILKGLDVRRVVDQLAQWSKGRDVALCCYEKPGDFCHRHLLADWLKENGYEVEEFGQKEEKQKVVQLDLFG